MLPLLKAGRPSQLSPVCTTSPRSTSIEKRSMNTQPTQKSKKSSFLFSLLAAGLGLVALAYWSRNAQPTFIPSWTFANCVRSRQTAASTPPTQDGQLLDVFQVYHPLATASDATHEGRISPDSACRVLLMEHSFGFSYGKPYIGHYQPPECVFNQVTINLTVTSRGRQFDRLAIMYMNDTEVYRTSTAEPTWNGIRWEYVKDMSAYISLWNSPQKIIFDLGNLINDVYNASFDTTLVASFSFVHDPQDAASAIVPISARKSSEDAASLFMLPKDEAINELELPRNIKRAIFSVSACGQAQEEFFWANTLQSDIDTFTNVTGTLFGHSPFREVQILIDGQIAGVHWPFPVIFTGGVVPGLWRPIVGIDAFDLQEHEIDISPWLPLLCDGKRHTFEIKVAGISNKNSDAMLSNDVGNSWYVTGKIFLWLDTDPLAVTIGTTPTISIPQPAIGVQSKIEQDVSGVSNETLTYTVHVNRTLTISSLVTSQHGTYLYTWTQSLAADIFNQFTNSGQVQHTIYHTNGIDHSEGGYPYKAIYGHTLAANTTFSADDSGNFTLDATLIQGRALTVQGTSVFKDPSVLSTELEGTAHYFASPNARVSTGYGSTSQVYNFTFTDSCASISNFGQKMPKCGGRYFRNVAAVNGTVVRNDERMCADCRVDPRQGNYEGLSSHSEWQGQGPRQFLGRGPGSIKEEQIQSSHADV